MPEWLTQLLITGGVPLAIVAGGYFANRKLGIASGQRTLVETLQGEVEAYQDKVNRLDGEFAACKTRLVAVEESERRLKAEVFQLRTELQNAVLKMNRPRTRRTRSDDSA